MGLARRGLLDSTVLIHGTTDQLYDVFPFRAIPNIGPHSVQYACLRLSFYSPACIFKIYTICSADVPDIASNQ